MAPHVPEAASLSRVLGFGGLGGLESLADLGVLGLGFGGLGFRGLGFRSLGFRVAAYKAVTTCLLQPFLLTSRQVESIIRSSAGVSFRV